MAGFEPDRPILGMRRGSLSGRVVQPGEVGAEDLHFDFRDDPSRSKEASRGSNECQIIPPWPWPRCASPCSIWRILTRPMWRGLRLRRPSAPTSGAAEMAVGVVTRDARSGCGQRDALRRSGRIAADLRICGAKVVPWMRERTPRQLILKGSPVR